MLDGMRLISIKSGPSRILAQKRTLDCGSTPPERTVWMSSMLVESGNLCLFCQKRLLVFPAVDSVSS